MQIRHLPPLLRFIPQFAQICIVFALNKFEANPFFRPVGSLESTQEARVALGYRLMQLVRIFRALQTSRVHP